MIQLKFGDNYPILKMNTGHIRSGHQIEWYLQNEIFYRTTHIIIRIKK